MGTFHSAICCNSSVKGSFVPTLESLGYDRTLPQERTLWALICAQAPSFTPSVEWMRRNLGVSVAYVKAGLRGLVERGILERHYPRDSKGRISKGYRGYRIARSLIRRLNGKKPKQEAQAAQAAQAAHEAAPDAPRQANAQRPAESIRTIEAILEQIPEAQAGLEGGREVEPVPVRAPAPDASKAETVERPEASAILPCADHNANFAQYGENSAHNYYESFKKITIKKKGRAAIDAMREVLGLRKSNLGTERNDEEKAVTRGHDIGAPYLAYTSSLVGQEYRKNDNEILQDVQCTVIVPGVYLPRVRA